MKEYKDIQESGINIPSRMLRLSQETLLLVLLRLSSPLETINTGSLGEVDAESAHVEAVEEAAETLVEACETLVEELEVHHVCFQVGHTVCQFSE